MTKPTFERRHFDLIARTVRDMVLVNCPTQQDLDAVNDARRNIAWRFVYALAPTNPNFNRARFLEACGVKE